MEELDFLNDASKIDKLKEINKKLGLENIETKYKHNNIIFVYSVPKVGSTSLVSSLKLFAFFAFVIIHIHSETMLEVFSNIKDITVIELINYNGYALKRNVNVIDIYRSPIEHKISTYFEKIVSFHFNTTNELLNDYKLSKIIKRFNSIFPYIAVGDIFIDKYKIDELVPFYYDNKYIFYVKNNIKYLKLRLMDVGDWRKILKKILNIDVVMVKDYSSSNKPFKKTYNAFLKNYKIPENLFNMIQSCKYFNYYYSLEEKTKYIEEWKKRLLYENFTYMTLGEYSMYEEISMENQINNTIDTSHYIYNGCVCQGCLMKRQNIIKKLLNGEDINGEKIIHKNANYELAKIKQNAILNKAIVKVNIPKKNKDNIVKSSMKNIIT